MTLIPEVAEFITSAPVGSGGLYILPVGVMCMFGPPLGGKLIDKFVPKPVLMSSPAITAGGFLMLAFASFTTGNAVLLIAGLSVMGLGMGSAMGAPTNYMILEKTSDTGMRTIPWTSLSDKKNLLWLQSNLSDVDFFVFAGHRPHHFRSCATIRN